MATEGEQLLRFVLLRAEQDKVRAASNLRQHPAGEALSSIDAARSFAAAEAACMIVDLIAPWISEGGERYREGMAILRALALPWERHPDYRAGWRPEGARVPELLLQ